MFGKGDVWNKLAFAFERRKSFPQINPRRSYWFSTSYVRALTVSSLIELELRLKTSMSAVGTQCLVAKFNISDQPLTSDLRGLVNNPICYTTPPKIAAERKFRHHRVSLAKQRRMIATYIFIR